MDTYEFKTPICREYFDKTEKPQSRFHTVLSCVFLCLCIAGFIWGAIEALKPYLG